MCWKTNPYSFRHIHEQRELCFQALRYFSMKKKNKYRGIRFPCSAFHLSKRRISSSGQTYKVVAPRQMGIEVVAVVVVVLRSPFHSIDVDEVMFFVCDEASAHTHVDDYLRGAGCVWCDMCAAIDLQKQFSRALSDERHKGPIIMRLVALLRFLSLRTPSGYERNLIIYHYIN